MESLYFTGRCFLLQPMRLSILIGRIALKEVACEFAGVGMQWLQWGRMSSPLAAFEAAPF